VAGWDGLDMRRRSTSTGAGFGGTTAGVNGRGPSNISSRSF
jgi:hypothetical protein